MEHELTVGPATASQVAELADVAARTFPLACPPSVAAEHVAAFVAENLSAQRFADYLRDPQRSVLAAVEDGPILGYAMLIHGAPDDPDVVWTVDTAQPTVEVSKLYVLPESHGSGVSAALLTAAIELASTLGAASLWLGVNQRNERAQRFYAKHGFTRAGTTTSRLGTHIEHDYVMVRSV